MHHCRRTLVIILALLSLLGWLAPRSAAAASSMAIGGGTVFVSAENFGRDFEKGLVELSGNVRVMMKDQYLSCDHAVINEKTHVIEARGSLVMSSPQAYVEGDSAVLDYQTHTGVIQNGYVKSGQVILEGEIVRKTGPNTYEADRSRFTACTTCPAGWTFSGPRMSARMGGYAFIKSPILEIADFPVLWLPYLIVPLKSERQTGLLTPHLDIYNAEELAFDLPFFWAISRSQDLTLTPKYYTHRGFKLLGNYRYMLSEDSQGEANFGIMNDKVHAVDKELSQLPGGGNPRRWFINYDHRYELPFAITQLTQINLVSDLRYPIDFQWESRGYGDPALENRFGLSHNTEKTHSSFDADYYVNMLKENPFSDNQDAVHRWPELRFSSVDQPLLGTNLFFRFNADYVNFTRNGFGFDDVIDPKITHPGQTVSYGRQLDLNRSGTATNTDGSTTYVGGGGVFNPSTDIVRTGQRLDLSPEVSYPLHAGPYLDVLPSLQFRHTQYAFSVSPPPSDPGYDTMPYRDYLYSQISLRTKFWRIYGDTGDTETRPDAKEFRPPPRVTSASRWTDEESRGEEDADRTAPARPDLYRHEIQPEVIASHMPWSSRPNHPFFKQSAQVPIFLENQPVGDEVFKNPDEHALQFDYYDRIANRTLLSFVLTNRLVRKRWLSGSPEYRQIAIFKLGQSYDFEEATRTDRAMPYSDIFANLELNVDRLSLQSTVNYYPYHRVAKSNSGMSIRSPGGGEFFGLQWVQNHIITRYVEQARIDADALTVNGGFKSKYLDVVAAVNLQHHTDGQAFRFQSWSGDFNIKPPGNCWGLKFTYMQEVTGKRNFQFSFDFNFGGESG